MVLPETDLPSAASIVAERLRDTIASRPIDTAEGPLSVTISVGVAGVDTARENLLDALTHADSGLYAAKHAGRNRVIRWTPVLRDVEAPAGPGADAPGTAPPPAAEEAS